MEFKFASLNIEISPCYLIAEIGVNHCGILDMAMELIAAAKESGADAVKFQTFTADKLVTKRTPKVRYQQETTSLQESHFDMIRSLEFSKDNHLAAMECSRQLGVDFISTPYDIDSADFLDRAGVSIFKTASADIVDLPLHHFLSSTRKPVIVATGMSTIEEIRTTSSIYEASGSPYALLHCVSNYPCSDRSLNLRAIPLLRKTFGTVVGYSDHSIDHQAALLAVALGAKIIERHFTLNKNLPGPDHKASMTPDEFYEFVQAIRRAECMLGEPVKECQDEEWQMAQVSRKSAVISRPVAAGELLTVDHIVMKRPGNGILAVLVPQLIGRRVKHSLEPDHLLTLEDLE